MAKTYSKNADFNEFGTDSLKITFIHGEESFLRLRGRSVYLTTLSVAKITYFRKWMDEIRIWKIGGMIMRERKNRNTQTQTCLNATFSTTNPTRTEIVSNPSL
jgi:hypothetical protein